MRIISGKYKGRIIEGYDIDGTRPTQDRVKESMFAMIQEYISDSICLDLFTGTGNLGIETLSNNASKCYFVDNNPKCIEILNKNLRNINNDYYETLCTSYESALKEFYDKKLKFDIIFLDPPYNLDCLDDIIETIIEFDLLNETGIIVCEYEFNNFNESYKNLELIKDRNYGYKNIRVYEKNS